MRAIDTNVLVRLIIRDDPRQLAAADEFVKAGAWVSLVVLVEAVWVLATVYDVQSAEIGKALEMLLNHRNLSLQEPEVVAAALEVFRKRPALGFSDCLVLEMARRVGHLPLGTFDRELAKVKGTERL